MNARLNQALLLLDNVIQQIDTGFVACERCGDQEETKNLDFADDVKEIKRLLLEISQEEGGKA